MKHQWEAAGAAQRHCEQVTVERAALGGSWNIVQGVALLGLRDLPGTQCCSRDCKGLSYSPSAYVAVRLGQAHLDVAHLDPASRQTV
jgi:hypothetical protein